MRVRWMTGFLDSPSVEVEPFWLALTGTVLSARRDAGTFATAVPADGDAYLRFQVSGGQAGAHVDLHVDDLVEGVAAAVGAGATVVREQEGLRVVRSPAGLVFCLVPWGGQARRPGAVRWGGHASLLDQVCLDVPERLFEAEAGFWGALTGWERRETDLPQFCSLRRPDGMPWRLLLQRTGSPAAGIHLDFACDDVDAEGERHAELGARVVRRVPGDWTTLRDPAGRKYCVTARSPYQ